jgi:hypothetical protein
MVFHPEGHSPALSPCGRGFRLCGAVTLIVLGVLLYYLVGGYR